MELHTTVFFKGSANDFLATISCVRSSTVEVKAPEDVEEGLEVTAGHSYGGNKSIHF